MAPPLFRSSRDKFINKIKQIALLKRIGSRRPCRTKSDGFRKREGSINMATAIPLVEQARLDSSRHAPECGKNLSVEHAMSCARGGFPSIRHNEIRDLTATLLTEVCNNVCTEPELQPVSQEALRGASANRQDGANGFWGGTFERTYFDVRVFNHLAPSNRHTQLSSAYRKHERIKKRSYERTCHLYTTCTLGG